MKQTNADTSMNVRRVKADALAAIKPDPEAVPSTKSGKPAAVTKPTAKSAAAGKSSAKVKSEPQESKGL